MHLKKSNIAVGVIICLLYCGVLLFVNNKNCKSFHNMFDNAINGIIVEKKINKIGGGKNYTTDNGFMIQLPHHDTIEVGDSISKIKNNSIINVYRKKNDTSYSFYKSYNIYGD